MARFRSRAGAPRKLGPWLFAGVFVMFWVLLAISGMDRFKAEDGDSRQYTVPAAQLQGVTRLRIEGDPGDARGYVPTTRVVLRSTSDVTLNLHLRREGRRKGARAATPAPGAEPPLVAVREGDTLVLRWLPRTPSPTAGSDDLQEQWLGEIVLPARFQHLALSHALVEVLDPVEQLHVSGRAVEVRGLAAHLDLQSTQCQRCAEVGAAAAPDDSSACDEQTHPGRNAVLEVNAKNMQSVRVVAGVGNVKLNETRLLRQLDLQLGDSVGLLVDRAAVLRLGRGAGGGVAGAAQGPVVAPADCAAPPAAGRNPVPSLPSVPLDLVRVAERSLPGQAPASE